MSLRPIVECIYQQHIDMLAGCEAFEALERGTASREDYDRFLANVIRTHLTSPQYLAFLFSVAPPAASERLKHNMLEELGYEEEGGSAHPDLLRRLAAGAGLDERLPELERQAQENLRAVASNRLLYGTLKEVALGALCEINAFEYMLSRISSRIARALAQHRKLDSQALRWFTHHSEVDKEHAEQGFESMDDFIDYYGFTEDDARTIVEMTMRENVFIKRYFGEVELGRAAGMIR